MSRIIRILLYVMLASIVYQGIFSLIHLSEGHTVRWYSRFHKMENEKSEFNAWAILSPFQVEAQKIVKDRKAFTHTVVYPLAPKFQCVAPAQAVEAKVANEIATVIKDSVQAMKISSNAIFNYDNQNEAVRRYAKPATARTTVPRINLSLFGTASPEAKKYGFKESMQPGHIEPENVALAAARLSRTKKMLLKDLADSHAGTVYVLGESSAELQFSSIQEADFALQNPAILDSMRFVRVGVTIMTEHVEVIPMTSPVALFLLIGALWYAFSLLRRVRIGGIAWPRFKFRPLDFSGVGEVLVWIASAIAVAFIAYSFRNIWWPLLLILAVVLSAVVMAVLLRLFRGIPFLELWEEFLHWWKEFWRMIRLLFFRIPHWFRRQWERLRKWWLYECSCCKFFLILTAILLIFWMFGWFHFELLGKRF